MAALDSSMFSAEDVARFWSKVGPADPVTGCRLWAAGTDGRGYGIFHLSRVGRQRQIKMRGHRVAWALSFGSIQPGEGAHGVCVCHHCDTPSCCEPSHLFLGSNADNVRDMVAKGRHVPSLGERNGNAKLDGSRVRRVFELRRMGQSHSVIARAVGVSRRVVGDILRGERWSHLGLARAMADNGR